MKTSINLLGYIFALINLAITVPISVFSFILFPGYKTNYFPLVLFFDFPSSIVVFSFFYSPHAWPFKFQVITYLLIGALQWFLVGWGISEIVNRLKKVGNIPD